MNYCTCGDRLHSFAFGVYRCSCGFYFVHEVCDDGTSLGYTRTRTPPTQEAMRRLVAVDVDRESGSRHGRRA